jgi:hypothetical protein
MNDQAPDPLTTSEIDIRELDSFMLNTERLLASETWAVSTGDEFKAAIGLWCRAWKQMPAGSLPNDERMLAGFSGAGPKWKKVRDVALRGFVLCSDGRLYHAILCQDVRRAWEAKKGRKARTEAARAARHSSVTDDVAESVTSSHRQGQGQGQGHRQVTISKNTPPPSSDVSPCEDKNTPAATASGEGLRTRINGVDPKAVRAAIIRGDPLTVVAAFGGNVQRADEWRRDAHGMTLGELATLFAWRFGQGASIREPSGLRASLTEWRALPIEQRRAHARAFAESYGIEA